MRTKSFNWEVVALLVLILIPWPGPTVFKISCPRDSARVVRKVVQKKWLPILEKRSVKLGMECPFHPSRDIFGTQQAAKQQHRPSQWTCAFCGKSFYTERHLDAHFDSRHRDTINVAEDAVCLADYCDVMRCEVMAAQEAGSAELAGRGTDMEVWRHASGSGPTSPRTALSVSAPRDLARVSKGAAIKVPLSARQKPPPPPQQQQSPRCSPLRAPPSGSSAAEESPRGATGTAPRDGDANATADVCGKGETQADLVDSSLPPHQAKAQARISEMQRLKANCKPEELQKLKTRCEILVRDCIAGLLVNLSIQDFKEIEDELNRASCWYLTCDRYWEDSPAEVRPFPWALLALMAAMLIVGVLVCYYIIWVLFDSDEAFCDTPAPRDPRGGPDDGAYPTQYYPGDVDGSDHYIYVTYPPDLKQRLLERPPTLTSTAGQQQPVYHRQQQQQQHYHQQYQQQHQHQLQMQQMQQMQQQHQAHLSHMQHLSRGNAGSRQDPFEREWKI